jgi:hypothetical protein
VTATADDGRSDQEDVMTDSRPCDPGPLDDLVCQAKGIAEQSKYNTDHEKELADARTALDNARGAYSDDRDKFDKELGPSREKLAKIFADRCGIDQAQRRRLDRAFEKVRTRLEDCRPDPCCVDDECDWDDDVGHCDEPDDVAALRARIEWHVKRATRCFRDLSNETEPPPPPPPGATATATATTEPAKPTEPPPPPGMEKRVANVILEIKTIEDNASKWPATKVYAAALVARWHLRTVWNGFADVNEYVDCLCRALNCMIRGHAAIARLERKAAVTACYRKKWDEACKKLDEPATAVNEVLAEYLRICAAGDDSDHDDDGCPPDDDGGGDGGGPYGRGGGHGSGREPSRPEPDDPGDDRRPRRDSGGYPPDDEPDRPLYADEPGGAPSDEPDRPGPRDRGARSRTPYRDARGRYRAP